MLRQVLTCVVVLLAAESSFAVGTDVADGKTSVLDYRFTQSTENNNFKCDVIIPVHSRGATASNVWDAYGLGVVPYDLSLLQDFYKQNCLKKLILKKVKRPTNNEFIMQHVCVFLGIAPLI